MIDAISLAPSDQTSNMLHCGMIMRSLQESLPVNHRPGALSFQFNLIFCFIPPYKS